MKIVTRLSLSIVGLVLAMAAMIGVAVDWSLQRSLSDVQADRMSLELRSAARDFKGSILRMRTSTLAGAQSVQVQALVESMKLSEVPSNAVRAQAVSMLRVLMTAEPDNLQLRLIGRARNGHELLRIERQSRGEPVENVPDVLLQEKGKRPYVQSALALPVGQVEISPIELNQEYGRIQVPYVPVIRSATPIRLGGSDENDAMLVINQDMRAPLERLRTSVTSSTVYLVDAQGRYLLHAQPEQEFAHEIGKAPRLQDEFPELAHLLTGLGAEAREMAFLHDDKPMVMATMAVVIDGGSTYRLMAVSPSRLAEITRQARQIQLGAILAAVLLGVFCAVMLARSLAQPLGAIAAATDNYLSTNVLTLPPHRSDEIGTLSKALERMDRRNRANAEAFANEEKRFRLVFESSSSALLMLDRARKIVLINRTAETLFGYDREELLGQTIERLVPESVRSAHPAHVTQYFEQPQARAMGVGRDLFACRKDGREVAVEISLDPIEMPDGRYTLASVVDITRRKRAHDELHRKNAELEQFAYIAAHDLQEPLRMVASYTELLAKRYQGQLDDKADKYIFYAVDGAKRMQRLVADLLVFSRVGTEGKPLEVVAVDAVVRQAMNALTQSISDSGARVEAANLPKVLGDEVQLAQLFQNLIGNAIKFRSAAVPRIIIRATRQHDRWLFEVKDNGIGIDIKYAERIFQMFQRLHERTAFDGSGIGLAIVKRIVERHEGRVWVASALGHGASFFFTLPAADASRDWV